MIMLRAAPIPLSLWLAWLVLMGIGVLVCTKQAVEACKRRHATYDDEFNSRAEKSIEPDGQAGQVIEVIPIMQPDVQNATDMQRNSARELLDENAYKILRRPLVNYIYNHVKMQEERRARAGASLGGLLKQRRKRNVQIETFPQQKKRPEPNNIGKHEFVRLMGNSAPKRLDNDGTNSKTKTMDNIRTLPEIVKANAHWRRAISPPGKSNRVEHFILSALVNKRGMPVPLDNARRTDGNRAMYRRAK